MENSHNKYQRWFDRAHLRRDIKAKSIRGGANTVGAQMIAFVLSLAANIIMARLLLPSDFGLVKMVTAVTGFVLIFKDLGFTQAIVQSNEVSHITVSKTFWLNLYVSIVLAVLIALSAPLLVSFYGEPVLFDITLAYAFTAILSGLSVQHTALLRRQMQFRKLANIRVGSTLAGVAVGIIFAYLQFSYWSIVLMNLFSILANAALVWIYCDWRPLFSRVDSSIASFARFGADMTGFSIVNYFSRNFDNILVGKVVGEVALGFYDRAYQLLMVPITQLRDPLNAVGISALSAMNAQSPDFKRYYYRFLFLMSFFSMPLAAFLGVAAEPVIVFLLGDKWLPAAHMFSLLSVVAFIQPVASTRGMVMIAAGHSRRIFLWGLINSGLTVAGFIIGVFSGGVQGLIIAYIISVYLLLAPSIQYAFKNTSLSLAGFFKHMGYPAIFSMLASLAAYFCLQQFGAWPPLGQIIMAFLAFSATYLLAFFSLHDSRQSLKQVAEVAHYLIQQVKLKFRR